MNPSPTSEASSEATTPLLPSPAMVVVDALLDAFAPPCGIEQADEAAAWTGDVVDALKRERGERGSAVVAVDNRAAADGPADTDKTSATSASKPESAPAPAPAPAPPPPTPAQLDASILVSLRSALRTWTVGMGMGVAFGVVMDRSGVANPATIRAQLLMQNFVMFKMFLAALGTSALALAGLERAWPADFAHARKARGFGDKGLVTMVTGGLIQGAGMAVAGACPGMMMVMTGSGNPDALSTVAGGLVGALAYGLLHPILNELHLVDFRKTFRRLNSGYLDEVRQRKFAAMSVPFGVLAIAASAGLNHVRPWEVDVVGLTGVRQSGAAGLMHPLAAGLVVGMLQVPAFVALRTFLGTSSAYSVITAQYLHLAPEKHKRAFSYMSSWLSSRAWWQVPYVVGALLGGYLSKTGFGLDGVPGPAQAGVGSLQGFVGGALLVYGARHAGGCASGHGISGMSLFNVTGWAAVPAMFAGAFATAFAMSHLMEGGADAFLLRA